MRNLFLAALISLFTTQAWADGAVTYVTDQEYDDVIFGLESAITDRGLVVDHVSHVGDMLERTRADVGSDVVIYTRAEVYSFCSASVSRRMMEADPMNLMFCPYRIFVMQTPDNPNEVTIGYQTMPEGEMKEVEALLDEIVNDAL